MNDLDILVKQEDAIKIRNLLLKNEFETDPIISSIFEKRIYRHGKHLPEMRKKGLSVEIHFTLFNQKGNSLTEDFLRMAVSTDNLEAAIPEHQLFFLYLIQHLDKHEKEGTSQVRLYSDLAVMLEKYSEQILTRRLFENASAAGIEGVVIEKLFILQTFWDLDLPEWVKNYCEKTQQPSLKTKFIWFLRHPDTQEPETEKMISFKTLNELEGISNKLFFIAGYGFPSVKYLKFRYKVRSGAVAILFYPVWWAKVSWLVIRGLVREW